MATMRMVGMCQDRQETQGLGGRVPVSLAGWRSLCVSLRAVAASTSRASGPAWWGKRSVDEWLRSSPKSPSVLLPWAADT